MVLSNLTLYVLDTTIRLDTTLSWLEPISKTDIVPHQLTAIIFWNFSMGTYMDDIPFDWEKLLRKKFANNINILKVNTEVIASWSEKDKADELDLMQRVLNTVNTSLQH